MSDPLSQFRDALSARGIIPPDIILTDGVFHRCDADGKNGRNDATYLYRPDDSGGFENHRDSLGWEDWFAKTDHKLTSKETAARKKQVEETLKQREAEEALRRSEAATKAGNRWEAAVPASPDHPYLARKGVKPHGIKSHEGNLIIPLRTGSDIHSLQTIYLDGTKRFLTGGRTGGCYYSIGRPDQSDTLCIVEGFATGASVHEATGYPVAVAFNAVNLEPVAKAMRERFPDKRLILCADDDYRTEGNPGVTKATKAAMAVSGIVATPDFDEDRPEGATDFNDLHQHRGLEAVRECISQAIELADVEPEKPAGSTLEELVAAKKEKVATQKRNLKPHQHAFGDGYFDVSEKGLTYVETGTDGNETTQWICSRLEILAKTRDSKSGEWGRLLQWQDADRQQHQWAMPMELLQGDGADFRKELARGGLEISPSQKSRNLMATYIQVCKVTHRARCVDRLGWHAGLYITPHETIGQSDEIVVFQNASAVEPALSSSGSIDQWRDTVARLAGGNSRMVFALSISFAAILAHMAGEDSGGFHFRGSSSSGKTTALHLAASVWGNPSSYTRLWRATANGLEGLAALHNDGLLILDELSQIDPREAGEAAYLLANGQGKTRASRSGAARKAAAWRLLFLSAGEESLTALMQRAGKRANAGQEIRLADIDSDAGTGMGAFEELHGRETPATLALALKDAASKYHGVAGMTWLRHIVLHRQQLPNLIADGIRQFTDRHTQTDFSGQVFRVAKRFALVAVAGELATYYGLTGWNEGEATHAAGKCFTTWLEGFGGTGNKEERAILSQVRAFFEAHGASRFEDDKATEDQRIISRAGVYRTNVQGEKEYLVLPEAFSREICQGFDKKTVEQTLLVNGWIDAGGDKRATQKVRISSIGKPTRCYVFTSKMWEDTE